VERILSATPSMREAGMVLFGNGIPVSGSMGLLADCEKSPPRSNGVGSTAVLTNVYATCRSPA